MGVEELTHRERKKQRTRELIVERAMALFDERGFEHVTIAEIAAAADIAPRTFFSYFRSKEDVVFPEFDDVFERIRRRIEERADDETTMDALRAFLEELLAQMDHGDPAEQCRRRVVRASPTLQQHDRELVGRIEQVIADGLAQDLGVARDSLRARVVAAAAAASLTELEHFFDKEAPPEDAMAVFDEVFTFVRGGMEALQRRPAKT